MKVITDEVGEDLWYRVRVDKISYNKVNGFVVGIILDMECDSQFAWSIEKNGQMLNDDKLTNYIKYYTRVQNGSSWDVVEEYWNGTELKSV